MSKISKERKVVIILDIIIVGLGIIIAALLLFIVIGKPVRVSGSSMEPTYHHGQVLITNRNFEKSDLHYGAVITFNAETKPDRALIKRIVGIPGDEIRFIDGICYINGNPEELSFEEMRVYPVSTIVLGDDEYYVLGDNRNNSNDSRSFGAIHYSDIFAIISEKQFFN